MMMTGKSLLQRQRERRDGEREGGREIRGGCRETLTNRDMKRGEWKTVEMEKSETVEGKEINSSKVKKMQRRRVNWEREGQRRREV